MRGDTRQIQTAVLGGAASEEPLTLPLEAIELDTFRRRHEHDTFWCGLLLGGCGGRLTTKLYTDRVCHFAHHPGPDGLPHCGRSARGVASADHLYVKAATAAWLRDRGEQAEFDFARPNGAAIGSVLDVRFESRGLRVHLDGEVAPVWDEDGVEPVLGVSVPVDDKTLVRRWYVHRIRLDSEGTHRRVRIGTEAFARGVEWFALDECEMTGRGLSTPTVERIVRSRSTRPVSTWGVSKVRKAPDAQARAQLLLRKLADARRVGSVVLVAQICRDIAAVERAEGEIQEQLSDAVVDAGRWLEIQAETRRKLFLLLEEAVTAGNLVAVGHLLVMANGTAGHDRTAAETVIAERASALLAADAQERQEETLAAQQEAERARRAAERVRALLSSLRRLPTGRRSLGREVMRDSVRRLLKAADEADSVLNTRERELVESWKTRAGLDGPPSGTGRPADKTSGAGVDREAALVPGQRPGKRHTHEVACPACGAAPGVRCEIPVGYHPSRVARLRRSVR
ncbi:hypothetical protein ACIQNK_37890 [Streptomyces sp. NPDC091273]|uniref:zinc finger domain-containing protein n=1 Tax=Streptomyces sp. NPDC091273 TaxID=3365982 RepID=UPI0037F74D4C